MRLIVGDFNGFRLAYGLFLSIVFPVVPILAQQSNAEPWKIVTSPQASVVYARDGSLIGFIGKESRFNVSLKTLPKYVAQAFIAVEDQRFYQHDGVDLVGVAGAIKDNLMGDRRGASTITQQLVGNMHPEIIDRTDKSVTRKLREQAAARDMERRYSKEQILEAYLNQISFGRGYFGIEVAARHYFGKAAQRMTLAEAATLAAMPKGPALYDPIRHPERVKERRNLILMLMAQQNYISQEQAREAQREPLKVAPNHGMPAAAQYYLNVVRIQAERAGVPITRGGYRISTALDPLLQTIAAEVLRTDAAAIESSPNYRHQKIGRGNDYLQGAVVVMDPSNGDVVALVGGRDYSLSEYDRAVDGMRQPGSAFKPFIYAAAIADSMTPVTVVSDTALSIPLPNGTFYRPRNADRKFLGELTLRDALSLSRNTVAVELAQQLTIDTVAALAARMGLKAPIERVPSSAIGASVVQPLNLVSAFTAFANMGTPMSPRFIHKIEDAEGNTVLSPPIGALKPAMDPQVAFVTLDMMREVVERGTGRAVRTYVPESIPVAGKTGTTDDNSDVWFIGLTPDLVGGVWLGFDKPRMITAGAGGGSLAAPVWGKIVGKYYSARKYRGAQWLPPLGVIPAEMDRVTLRLATADTPASQRYTEYFVEGTEPEELKLDPWLVFRKGAVVF